MSCNTRLICTCLNCMLLLFQYSVSCKQCNSSNISSSVTRIPHFFFQLLSSSRPTWFVSLGTGAKDAQRVAVIQKDAYKNSHSASLFLNGNTSQFFAQPVPDYSARGDIGNRSFFIYHGAAPVAEVCNAGSITRCLSAVVHMCVCEHVHFQMQWEAKACCTLCDLCIKQPCMHPARLAPYQCMQLQPR